MLAAVLAGALLPTDGAGGGARSHDVAASAARAPVLGVSYPGGPRGRIARHDPVTLERVGRSAPVRGYLWASDRSPSGGAVALAVSNRGRVQIFGTRPVAFSRTIETGRREGVSLLRWVTPERMVALAGRSRTDVLDLDLARGRVAARRPLGGRAYGTAKAADGLAVLVGPRDGDAWLVLVTPGASRRIDLPGARVRLRTTGDLRPDDPPELFPGLVVDGNVAYVAPAGAPRIVRVDLASGAATSHALAAGAAKGGAAQTRFLQALGGGRLLLTAQDVGASGRVERQSSQIVDTATWSLRTLSASNPHAVGSAEGIVLPDYRRRLVDVLDPAGRRLLRLRPRFGISNVRIHGRYGYVFNGARRGRNVRTHVVDLRAGRKLGSVPSKMLPHLLP